jgi:putative membrane protein
MCVAQSFVDFIPSIFLGAPSPDTFEGVLPGHAMMMKGKAYEAICLTVFGGLIALLAGTALTPLFFLYIQENGDNIIAATPAIIIFALAIMAGSEKGWKKKAISVFIIAAAATQGMLFRGQIFPLITGYFGIAGILYSIKEKPFCVKQSKEADIKIRRGVSALVGTVGGAIVAVMPGIGSNVAAGMIKAFSRKIRTKDYLVMLGSINVSNFFFSYATLFAISKARNGAMLAIKDKFFATPETLYYGTLIMLISGGAGGLIALALSKKAASFFTEKRTLLFSVCSLILMAILVGLFNGTVGITAMLFAAALGLFGLTQKTKRSCCMGALVVPTLFFYVFILI